MRRLPVIPRANANAAATATGRKSTRVAGKWIVAAPPWNLDAVNYTEWPPARAVCAPDARIKRSDNAAGSYVCTSISITRRTRVDDIVDDTVDAPLDRRGRVSGRRDPLSSIPATRSCPVTSFLFSTPKSSRVRISQDIYSIIPMPNLVPQSRLVCKIVWNDTRASEWHRELSPRCTCSSRQ